MNTTPATDAQVTAALQAAALKGNWTVFYVDLEGRTEMGELRGLAATLNDEEVRTVWDAVYGSTRGMSMAAFPLV